MGGSAIAEEAALVGVRVEAKILKASDPRALALFQGMQAGMESGALDPLDAARHMIGQFAQGQFWIFSDEPAGSRYMRNRAEHRC